MPGIKSSRSRALRRGEKSETVSTRHRGLSWRQKSICSKNHQFLEKKCRFWRKKCRFPKKVQIPESCMAEQTIKKISSKILAPYFFIPRRPLQPGHCFTPKPHILMIFRLKILLPLPKRSFLMNPLIVSLSSHVSEYLNQLSISEEMLEIKTYFLRRRFRERMKASTVSFSNVSAISRS